MPELAAQIAAPESVAQTEPTCVHCGAPLELDPRARDCCHRITADIQAMQLESPRQAGRYVLAAAQRIERLVERVEALEARILELETAPPVRKAKG